MSNFILILASSSFLLLDVTFLDRDYDAKCEEKELLFYYCM